MDFKQKYLKYKNKYIEMKAGAAASRSIELHPEPNSNELEIGTEIGGTNSWGTIVSRLDTNDGWLLNSGIKIKDVTYKSKWKILSIPESIDDLVAVEADRKAVAEEVVSLPHLDNPYLLGTKTYKKNVITRGEGFEGNDEIEELLFSDGSVYKVSTDFGECGSGYCSATYATIELINNIYDDNILEVFMNEKMDDDEHSLEKHYSKQYNINGKLMSNILFSYLDDEIIRGYTLNDDGTIEEEINIAETIIGGDDYYPWNRAEVTDVVNDELIDEDEYKSYLEARRIAAASGTHPNARFSEGTPEAKIKTLSDKGTVSVIGTFMKGGSKRYIVKYKNKIN